MTDIIEKQVDCILAKLDRMLVEIEITNAILRKNYENFNFQTAVKELEIEREMLGAERPN